MSLYRDLAQQIILSPRFVSAMTDMMSKEIETQLQVLAGGDRLYIPKTSSNADKAIRNALLRNAFNGHNHAELARRYAITVRQVRRILRIVDAPAC